MTWYVAGALAIVVLLALNSVVYLVRSRRRPDAAAPRPSMFRQTLPRSEAAILLATLGAWAVCFGAEKLAPESALGQAMARPWALASLYAWLTAAAIVASVVVRLRRDRAARKDR